MSFTNLVNINRNYVCKNAIFEKKILRNYIFIECIFHFYFYFFKNVLNILFKLQIHASRYNTFIKIMFLEVFVLGSYTER